MSWSRVHDEVVVVVLLILAVVGTPAVFSDMAFVQKTCSQTEHKEACLAMILAVPGGVNCTELGCAAGVGSGVTLNYARNTSSYIDRLREDRPPGQEAEALSFCATLFGTIVNDVEDAMQQIQGQQYAAASHTIGGTQDSTGKCEGAFPSHPNRMTDSNKRMGELLDVLWQFVDQLSS